MRWNNRDGMIEMEQQIRVLGFGIRVRGCGIRVRGFGIRVRGFGIRVRGFGIRVRGFACTSDPEDVYIHPRLAWSGGEPPGPY